MLKNFIKHLHKMAIPLCVTVISTFALYLRLVCLYKREFWHDELCSLALMKGTFIELLKLMPVSEYCSYLSGDLYLMFPFTKILPYNKWGLAIPHLVVTVVGFYLLYLICKRYLKSVWAYIITFGIVCFNATLIEHASEIRIYAILPTIALFAFYLFQKIADLNFELSLPKRIAATIIFILVIWSHVYGILIFASSFIFVTLSKYGENEFKNSFKKAIYFAAIILFFAMPFWVYCILGRHFPYEQLKVDPFEYIPNPFYNVIGFLKGIFCNLIGYKKFYFLLPGVIIPFIFSYKNRCKQLLLLFCNIFAPIIFILTFDLMGQYWFLQRQFIWVMPLFAFFLGWAFDSLFIMLKNIKSKKSLLR